MPTLATRAPVRAPAPFLKWAGGKGRILAQLVPLLPPGADRSRHVEPFFGGGALFFARRPARALVADVNAELVSAYLCVRDDVEAVIRALAPLARAHDEGHYYALRDRYNAGGGDPSERAAMFIYLNRTCFNGLHRVNRRGAFNVPAGRYRKPRILDPEGLRLASRALAGADVRHADFAELLLSSARPGDFVYFDPPYHPVSGTARFTDYATGGFGPDDQVRLRDVFRELDRRGCRLMLSNSDTPFVRDLYRGFTVDVVAAPRAINSDRRGRGLVSEVVVRNYR